jgi:K+ transporter
VLGLLIGVVSGAVQFFLLARFTLSATSGKMGFSAVVYGLIQFFLPFAVLVLCAVFLRSDLIWAASGIAGTLIIASVVKFILERRSEKSAKGGDNGDAR